MDWSHEMTNENRQLSAHGSGAFGETLRRRIDASAAVNLLNRLITGEIEELSATRVNGMKLAMDKCLPDLKAVGVMIKHDGGNTKEDIDAMLIEAGLQPRNEYIDKPVINGELSTIVDSGIIDVEKEDCDGK